MSTVLVFLKYIAIIYIRIEIDLYFVCYTSADKKIPSWLTDLGWILKYLDAAGCKAFHSTIRYFFIKTCIWASKPEKADLLFGFGLKYLCSCFEVL